MDKLTISLAASSLPASPIRKLIPLADEAKKKGIEVLHLNIGQPDIPTPKPIIESLKKLKIDIISYGRSEGEIPLRQAIVKYYNSFGVNISCDEVVVTIGGSEAIFFSYFITCNPDDEVICFEPIYTNYIGLSKIARVKLVPVITKVEDGFHLPPKEIIERAITTRTKAIIIINPNNPTGTTYTQEELERVAEIAKKHHLFVIADEVYREFIYDEKTKHLSMLKLKGLEENTIIIDSVSKRFSMCGARVGCLISKNKNIIKSAIKLAQARLSPPIIDEMASEYAFSMPLEDSVYPMIKEYKIRRDITCSMLAKMPGVVSFTPEGAFYVVAKLPIKDADDFCAWLLSDFNVDKKTVMLAPASGFYVTPGRGRDEVRIAYVLEKEKIVTAMNILAQALRVYNE